jgi:Multicopper oxidase
MSDFEKSRRRFLSASGLTVGSVLLSPGAIFTRMTASTLESIAIQDNTGAPDYTLHIKESPIEIAPKHIISTTTYNGQFPGPLLRFNEGQQITIDIFNDSDTPNSFIGTVRKYQPMWTEPPRKARHTFPHAASSAARSRRILLVSAFITRIIARVQTFTPDNMVAK